MNQAGPSARPSEPSEPSRPWLALSATFSVQMMASLALAAAPVLAPAVAPQLGLAPERVGLFVGLAYAVAMVTGLASGALVARFGAVRLMLAVLLMMAAGAAVASAGQPHALLLLGAAIVGVGYGTVNPAATEILGRHAPPGAPGLFFALKQAGVPVGVALAGLLLPLGLITLGWRGATWAMAAACLLLALLLLPTLSTLESPPQSRRRGGTGSGWFGGLALALKLPPLRRLSLVSLAYAMTQQGFLTFVVALLHLELGLPLVGSAGLLAASQVACVFVRIGAGHVADRWVQPQRLLGAFGLVMALACLALALLPRGVPLPIAVPVVVAVGATTMGWNGVYFAQLIRSVPREVLAAGAGGAQFFTFGGSMLGSLLFGWLVHAGASHAQGFAALALVAATAGLAMLRSDARAPAPAA